MPDEIIVIPSAPVTVGVYSGQPGPQGVPGATGPTGPTGPGVTTQQILDVIVPAVSYRHTQSAALTTWTITHNLHFRPNITAFDSAGNIAEGNVTHTSTDALTIQFSAAISGTAVLS
jgi:hypothetical protein